MLVYGVCNVFVYIVKIHSNDYGPTLDLTVHQKRLEFIALCPRRANKECPLCY